MFRSRLGLGVTAASAVCVMILIGLYLYSGSIFPTPMSTATRSERIWLYIEAFPLYMMPLFSTIYIFSRKHKGS